MGLFTKKPLDVLLAQAMEDGEHTLKRSLGPWNLTALGVGVTIGAGIFVLTGQAAAQHAGPAIVISFLIAALACAFAALCYAELASMIPVSGSAYTYAYAAFGELVAWIIAWDLIIEYLFAASAVAVGWSGYAVGLLESVGIYIPAALSQAPITMDGHEMVLTGAFLNLPAVAIVGLGAMLLFLGTSQSAKFNNAVVGTKVTIILLVILVGIFYVNPSNWSPFIPERVIDDAGQGRYGMQGIFAAAGIVFFAFLGFEAVSTAAQEVRDPHRNMPIGILASLTICTLLYVMMSMVITGLAPYHLLNVAAPIYTAIDYVGADLAWLKPLVSLGGTVGLASTVLILLYGQSRIFYAMSRDGLLPPIFSKVHPKRRTPWFGTLFTATFAAILAGLFPIGVLAELVSVGTLLSFAVICAGVMYLRIKHPDHPRHFKVPVWPITTTLGIVLCLYLILSLPGATFVRLIAWFAIGLVVYLGYARRKSVLGGKAGTSDAIGDMQPSPERAG